MYNNIHSDYILRPLYEQFSQGLHACMALNPGIETHPLKEYYLQSLFLKLTGAQEQKLGCLSWDIATDDLEYRWKYKCEKSFGCSSYKDKQAIIQNLKAICMELKHCKAYIDPWKLVSIEMGNDLFQIRKEQYINHQCKRWCNNTPKSQQNSVTDENDKKEKYYASKVYKNDSHEVYKGSSLISVFEKLNESLQDSFLYHWLPRQYAVFKQYVDSQIDYANIDGKCLFIDDLQSIYGESVYKFRNACAHNLVSSKTYFPSFAQLSDDINENYFLRLWMLLIIDEIIMAYYKCYHKCCSINCL